MVDRRGITRVTWMKAEKGMGIGLFCPIPLDPSRETSLAEFLCVWSSPAELGVSQLCIDAP